MSSLDYGDDETKHQVIFWQSNDVQKFNERRCRGKCVYDHLYSFPAIMFVIDIFF